MAKLAKWFTILKNFIHIPICDRGEATGRIEGNSDWESHDIDTYIYLSIMVYVRVSDQFLTPQLPP